MSIKLNKDPASTYGATEAYKEAWHKEFGNVTPAASASKEDWEKFATDKGGMTKDGAEAMTRDALVEHFGGGGVVFSAPSAPTTTAAPAGEGPSGNVANDPTNTTATGTTGTRTGTGT